MAKGMGGPHPNSMYSRIMKRGDKEEIAALRKWQRTQADDRSAFEKWYRDGFNGGQGQRTDKNREDVDLG